MLEVIRRSFIALAVISFLVPISPIRANGVEKTGEESLPGYVKTLPKNLLLGTKESLWGWNLVLLWVGAGTSITLSQTDADREIQEDVKGSIGDFADIGNIGGNGFTLAGVSLLTYMIGRMIYDERVVETGKALIESQIITAVMTGITKVSTGRRRPDGSGNRFTSSFPSGHASGAFAMASTVDVMYGHRIGIPLYAFAGFVGFSRLSDNEHFLSDVLFGAVLGTVVGRGVARFHQRRDDTGLSILPYSDGSGVGLSLILSW